MSSTDEAMTGQDEPRTARRPPRRVVLFAAVAVCAWALDLVSKVLVAANLRADHDEVRLLGGALYLDQARNSGAAFSLGTGFTVALSVIAIAVIALIARFASRLRSVGWAVALGLILGGALGNLTDRIFREPGVFRGHVVDWISVFGPWGARWPIFNLADAAIVCGAVLAGVLSLRGIALDGETPRPEPAPPAEPAAGDPPRSERATTDPPPVEPPAGSGPTGSDSGGSDGPSR